VAPPGFELPTDPETDTLTTQPPRLEHIWLLSFLFILGEFYERGPRFLIQFEPIAEDTSAWGSEVSITHFLITGTTSRI